VVKPAGDVADLAYVEASTALAVKVLHLGWSPGRRAVGHMDPSADASRCRRRGPGSHHGHPRQHWSPDEVSASARAEHGPGRAHAGDHHHHQHRAPRAGRGCRRWSPRSSSTWPQPRGGHARACRRQPCLAQLPGSRPCLVVDLAAGELAPGPAPIAARFAGSMPPATTRTGPRARWPDRRPIPKHPAWHGREVFEGEPEHRR
jgi:hypothetical protein